MSDSIATKAAAEACDTTPRTLRIFLRASKDYTAVGSGSRYAFTEDDLPELKTRFADWLAEREAAQAAKDKAAKEGKAKTENQVWKAIEDSATVEGKDKPSDDTTATEAKPATRSRTRKTTAAA